MFISTSFLVPFVVFLILNVFENFLNYQIGRRSEKIELPSKTDLIKMISVLLLFAVLQGLLTYLGEWEFGPKTSLQ